MERNYNRIELEKEERVDDTGFGGLKLVQRPDEFCYGVDAVLLASAAAEGGAFRTIADLGAGTGVIPLILSHKTDAELILGVEIQERSCRSAEKTIKLNGLEGRVMVVQGDVSRFDELRDKINEAAGEKLQDGCFDAVTANPPYTGGSKGLTNSTDAKMIARHEVACTLEDFFTAAAGLLKSKGHFFMIHRPARLVDIFSLGRKYGLEPKEIRMIRPDKKSSPSMVLVHMIRNGGAELKVGEDLFIRDESGDYSREIEEIYERGKYQK